MAAAEETQEYKFWDRAIAALRIAARLCDTWSKNDPVYVDHARKATGYANTLCATGASVLLIRKFLKVVPKRVARITCSTTKSTKYAGRSDVLYIEAMGLQEPEFLRAELTDMLGPEFAPLFAVVQQQVISGNVPPQDQATLLENIALLSVSARRWLKSQNLTIEDIVKEAAEDEKQKVVTRAVSS